MSQPEKPWIVFSAAVREMVGPTLQASQKVMEARADQSDQMVEKLRNQVGELAEAHRQVARQLEELRQELRKQPPPPVVGRVDGSFAQLYEFNDWLGKAIKAQEAHAHRTAAALQAENRELQSRIDSLERRLDSRKRTPSRSRPAWQLAAALSATVVLLAFIVFLVM